MLDRWLLNLGLLLVALLGLVLYYLRGTEQEPSVASLTTLEPMQIERVRIVFDDGEQVSLHRQQGRWSLVTPLRARVSEAMMHNLMTLAMAGTTLQLPASVGNLQEYGLDTPKATIWLNDTEIRVGTEHPFKNARYVLHENQVHLISMQNLQPAAYRYRNLIDKRLLKGGSDLVAIVLPQRSLRLRDKKWELQPSDADLTPNQISAFVDAWRLARAFSVESYSGKPVLDRIRLTLQRPNTDKHEKLELAILSYAPEFVLYRADEKLEYRFTEQTGERLLHITPNAEEAGRKPNNK